MWVLSDAWLVLFLLTCLKTSSLSTGGWPRANRETRRGSGGRGRPSRPVHPDHAEPESSPRPPLRSSQFPGSAQEAPATCALGLRALLRPRFPAAGASVAVKAAPPLPPAPPLGAASRRLSAASAAAAGRGRPRPGGSGYAGPGRVRAGAPVLPTSRPGSAPGAGSQAGRSRSGRAAGAQSCLPWTSQIGRAHV